MFTSFFIMFSSLLKSLPMVSAIIEYNRRRQSIALTRFQNLLYNPLTDKPSTAAADSLTKVDATKSLELGDGFN